MTKTATNKSARPEKKRHYRLMHQVYRLCTAGGWSLRYMRIHGNAKACKRLGIVSEDGSGRATIVGAADRKSKMIFVDYRFDVIGTFLHECLHILLDHRFLAHQHEAEEREVQRLEQLMMRNLTPLQAERLHALMLAMLRVDPDVVEALDVSEEDIEVECLVEGIE